MTLARYRRANFPHATDARIPAMSFRVLLRIIAIVVALAGCAQFPDRPNLPSETALPVGTDGALDRVIAAAEARHPGQSAFRLSVEGTEAFVTRAHSARMASRSLDVQMYIWRPDLTGLVLAHEIV